MAKILFSIILGFIAIVAIYLAVKLLFWISIFLRICLRWFSSE